MKKVEVNKSLRYDAAGHFNMAPFRLHGKEETGVTKFTVGLSHFLPGGGADWSASGTEKVYICLEGEITIKFENESVVLKPTDSIFIGAGEGRSIINETNFPASMYVIVA